MEEGMVALKSLHLRIEDEVEVLSKKNKYIFELKDSFVIWLKFCPQ